MFQGFGRLGRPTRGAVKAVKPGWPAPRRSARPAGRRGFLVVLTGFLVAAGTGCEEAERPAPPEKPPETLAVEEKAGDFLAYYEEVIVLSRRHSAFPDSFQAALRELPGSNLSNEEWEAWTAPYRDDPRLLTLQLENTIANLGRGNE